MTEQEAVDAIDAQQTVKLSIHEDFSDALIVKMARRELAWRRKQEAEPKFGGSAKEAGLVNDLESFLKENKATEEDLVAAFETQAANFDTPPANASALVVERLDFPDNLMNCARAAFQKQQVRTVVGPTTPEWKVIFLSAIAKTDADIPKVARALTEEINKLAEMGVLVGHLAPLSTVKLALGHGTAVFIFPVVKWEFVAEWSEFACLSGPLDLRLYVQQGECGEVYE